MNPFFILTLLILQVALFAFGIWEIRQESMFVICSGIFNVFVNAATIPMNVMNLLWSLE